MANITKAGETTAAAAECSGQHTHRPTGIYRCFFELTETQCMIIHDFIALKHPRLHHSFHYANINYTHTHTHTCALIISDHNTGLGYRSRVGFGKGLAADF